MGDDMIYEIRLKARQKQAECSSILFLSFFVTLLSVLSVGLIPLVYTSAIKPHLSGYNKLIALALSTFLLLLTTVIYSALSMGCDRFMLKRAENTAAGAGDIFYYFSPRKLISFCRFALIFALIKLIIFVFLSLPCVICAAVFVSLCLKGFSAAVCGIFAVFTLLFLLLALRTYFYICDTFFFVRYRYIRGDYLTLKQLFSSYNNDAAESIKKLRKIKLSFSGWFLLCVLIVPVPYVWSYYRQSKACFAADENNL